MRSVIMLDAIRAAQRMEAAYERRMYRYKAHYSLDYGNGIEKATVSHALIPAASAAVSATG